MTRTEPTRMTRPETAEPRPSATREATDAEIREALAVTGRVYHREAEIPGEVREALRADSDAPAIPRFSLSSETEVVRYDWLGQWIEKLDHSPGSVRMERAVDSPALFVNHDRNLQAGAWRDVGLEADRVIRGSPVFSRSMLGTEIRQDVEDGIRTKTSVGYRVHRAILEEVRENDVEVWRIIDWEPLEFSIASIPADVTVGAGRTAAEGDADADLNKHSPRNPAREAEEETVEKNTAAGSDGARGNEGAGDVRVTGEGPAEKRATEIVELCDSAGTPGLALELIRSGVSVREAAGQILARQRETLKATGLPAPPQGARVDLPEAEGRRFSIASAIRQACGMEKPGLEFEISAALEQSLPPGVTRAASSFEAPGPDAGSILVPTFGANWRKGEGGELVRTGLDTATSTKGSETVFTEYGGFLEKLRNRMVLAAMGIDFMPGLQGNVTFVKQTGAATFYWVGENDSTDVTTSDPTLGTVTLSPKTGQANTYYSRQLLRQNFINVDAKVEDDLAKVHALGIDLAGLHGTGASNQPTGITKTSGINTVAIDGVISFAKVVDMETAILADNADIGRMGYVTTPEVRGAAKQTEKASNTGQFLWTGGPGVEGEMNGYRAMASNQVTKDYWDAGARDGRHGLIFGAWDSLMLGEWGVMELIVDPYALKKQGLIEVTSFQMVDVQLKYAEAFCSATGLVLATATS